MHGLPAGVIPWAHQPTSLYHHSIAAVKAAILAVECAVRATHTKMGKTGFVYLRICDHMGGQVLEVGEPRGRGPASIWATLTTFM